MMMLFLKTVPTTSKHFLPNELNALKEYMMDVRGVCTPRSDLSLPLYGDTFLSTVSKLYQELAQVEIIPMASIHSKAKE